jgi:hypothetical protein
MLFLPIFTSQVAAQSFILRCDVMVCSVFTEVEAYDEKQEGNAET